ncbi:MAG: hypothetical protein KIT83_03305 [Bryobacterales bacterium]|nr:hypothetical protein [Bryobacterales bacterium]
MPVEWNPPQGDPRCDHDRAVLGTDLGNRSISAAESEVLDQALQALARDSQDAEPSAWLEASILQAARQQGLLVPKGESSASTAVQQHDAAWRWIWQPAMWTMATVAAVTALLWIPAWRESLSVPEKPLPGLAVVASVPPEASLGGVTGDHAGAPALAAIAKPRSARKPRAVTSPRETVLASAPVAPRNGMNPDTEGAAPPSMEWPAEVLAAARQMTQRNQIESLPARFAPEQTLQSVRVRMGANDLWRMGLSSAPTPNNQAVLADFLVGEDGRPLAVRLVGVYP